MSLRMQHFTGMIVGSLLPHSLWGFHERSQQYILRVSLNLPSPNDHHSIPFLDLHNVWTDEGKIETGVFVKPTFQESLPKVWVFPHSKHVLDNTAYGKVLRIRKICCSMKENTKKNELPSNLIWWKENTRPPSETDKTFKNTFISKTSLYFSKYSLKPLKTFMFIFILS